MLKQIFNIDVFESWVMRGVTKGVQIKIINRIFSWQFPVLVIIGKEIYDTSIQYYYKQPTWQDIRSQSTTKSKQM